MDKVKQLQSICGEVYNALHDNSFCKYNTTHKGYFYTLEDLTTLAQRAREQFGLDFFRGQDCQELCIKAFATREFQISFNGEMLNYEQVRDTFDLDLLEIS